MYFQSCSPIYASETTKFSLHFLSVSLCMSEIKQVFEIMNSIHFWLSDCLKKQLHNQLLDCTQHTFGRKEAIPARSFQNTYCLIITWALGRQWWFPQYIKKNLSIGWPFQCNTNLFVLFSLFYCGIHVICTYRILNIIWNRTSVSSMASSHRMSRLQNRPKQC